MDKEDGLFFNHGKKILPFATTRRKLGDFMLTEISRTKTNTVGSHLHAESEEAAFIETE